MIPDRLHNTVSFLGLFSKVDGLKYLTHVFDSASGDDFLEHVTRCSLELSKVKDLIPYSLYNLVFGFIEGPYWTDSEGCKHNEHCSCDKWINWCLDNPGCHPFDAFTDEFEAFKNSIRIYNGTLDEYFVKLSDSKRFKNVILDPDIDSLEGFDSYMDVRQFKNIVTKFIEDIDRHPRVQEHPTVRITCSRLRPTDGGVKIDDVCISQIGSFPQQDISQAMEHFRNGGGLLASLKTIADGNFILYLETSWAGNPIRWNLSDSSTEPIDSNAVDGFRLIIRVYHRR